MMLNFRDALIRKAAEEIAAAESEADSVDQDELDSLLLLLEHLREGVPSPLVYRAAMNYHREWKR